MARRGNISKSGLVGINTVMRNLNKEFKKIKGRSLKGLILAAAEVRRDMDMTPPKIPVDVGNLRSSWFITTGTLIPEAGGNFSGEDAGSMSGNHSRVVGSASAKAKTLSVKGPVLIMGFSANYSVAVHETMKVGKRPGSGGKFFESALKRNQGKIIAIVAKEARI